MITFKMIAAAGKYHDDNAIPDVVNYITRKDKATHRYIFGAKVDQVDIAGSMRAVSKFYGKDSQIRLHHFVVSFPEKQSNIEVLVAFAKEVCAYLGTVYQVVAAIHEDRQPGLHIHFVFNAVSYVNGYKYHGSKGDYRELIDELSSILYRHRLYPLVPMKYHPDGYDLHE